MTGHGERGGPGVISGTASGQETNVVSSALISKDKVGQMERDRERDGSMDATSQNQYLGSMRPAGYNPTRGREDSEAKENNYFIQNGNNDKASVSLGYVETNFDLASLNNGVSNGNAGGPSINQVSPRGPSVAETSNISRMNVMNFLKPKNKNERSERDREDKSNDSRFLAPLDRDNQEYQKVINRQGSKKMI